MGEAPDSDLVTIKEGLLEEQLLIWNENDKDVPAQGKAVKVKETKTEAKSIWDIVGPVSSLAQLPSRVILVVVREVSSREIIKGWIMKSFSPFWENETYPLLMGVYF